MQEAKKKAEAPRALRAYQRDAFAYAKRQRHSALFMEMRLGKSLVAIRRILTLQPLNPDNRLRVLIVAPSSALGGWKDELLKERQEDIALLIGAKKKRSALLAEQHTWNLLNKEGYRALPQIAEINWDALILDESTFIKNPRAGVTRFFCKHFRDVPHRFILSGCPNPEGELDFFMQFKFLNGGSTFRSGNFYLWQRKNFVLSLPQPGAAPDVLEPEQLSEKEISLYLHSGYSWQPKPEALREIKSAIARDAFVLRRKDAGLGERKIRETRYVEMPPEARSIYSKVEDEFALALQGRAEETTKYRGAQFSWLHQLSGGFADGQEIWKEKIQALAELLEGELSREQVVVWYRFNQEISACARDFRERGSRFSFRDITGSVPMVKRFEIWRSFQRGEFRLLLMQLDCARYGADLSAADTAVYFSRPLPLETRIQSEDRIVSVSKKSPLLYIDLLAEDSIDEDIHEMLYDKRYASDGMLGAIIKMQARREKHDTK